MGDPLVSPWADQMEEQWADHWALRLGNSMVCHSVCLLAVRMVFSMEHHSASQWADRMDEQMEHS